MSAQQWVPWIPGKSVIRKAPHAMTRKILSWMACARCGLLALRNEATRRALKRPCVWEEEA